MLRMKRIRSGGFHSDRIVLWMDFEFLILFDAFGKGKSNVGMALLWL